MIGFNCSCSDTLCATLGCKQWRMLMERQVNAPTPRYEPMPNSYPGANPVPTLTEEDVRRIVRDELRKAAQ